jgi:hypothetical protein
LIVVIILLILGAVFIVLKIAQLNTVTSTKGSKATKEASKTTKEKGKSNKYTKECTGVEKVIIILYCWLLFPIASGFWLVLSLSGYVGSLRFEVEREGLFASSFCSSLAMLVTWAATGCIFFFEVCYCDVTHRLRGEKNVSNWYTSFFLLRIGCLSLLLQLGVYL